MKHPLIIRRGLVVATAILTVLFALTCLICWYGFRDALQKEASYHAGMRQFHRDQEAQLRTLINELSDPQISEAKQRENVDHTFERLKLNYYGNNSREVSRWEDSPHSLERTAVALRWAKFTADESAYMAKVYEIVALDFAKGHMPHHITNDELPPLKMPDWWTAADSKWSNEDSKPQQVIKQSDDK